MKLSHDLVGRLVAIQLGRPLLMFEYAAHVKQVSGEERLMGKPMIVVGPGGPQDPENRARESALLLGATVEAIGDDWVRVSLVDSIDPKGEVGNRIEVTIPSLLILQIVEIVGFEVPMPSAQSRVRAPSSLIMP